MSSDDAASTVGSLVTAPLRVAQAIPIVGSVVGGVRRRVSSTIDDVVAQLIKAIVDALADEVDLTQFVIDSVDIETIVAHVDLDRIIRQVDLIGLADEIIDGVDLNAIIRDASTSVTADVMTDVRSGGERADDAVAEFVGRMLGRNRAAKPGDADA
ncbi:hypothetical protein HH308_04660 [Gordonia sp. TBRC 11910]|uniref:Uncharacterized protein n=1 Tax=Gordonia asplenii TaxID=2725283 RepID=A0A848KN83_9ACTN|nr:hypothetical protein [Gordonia asplenii]NMO00504.1 hypothetical protein [Gordonia asplenii]